ncbi:hypothetical protein F5884DRAFT_758907 [Xylogone sp. PMI_703]|nr:hypothetical protein F5884DRAFT_758907 [Xylogone sp. PMI_703]
MEPHIIRAIRDYDIVNKIGFFTGDNDTKINTCLRKLAQDLETEYGIDFDPVLSRTRYNGHIINLSLQTFLFASNEEALQAAIDEAIEKSNDITIIKVLQHQVKSKT